MPELHDRLKAILAYKKDEVAALRRTRSLSSLEDDARNALPVRDFAGALVRIAEDEGNALICEMKRKSPSAGEINADRTPADVARAYEAGGAACLSILTDFPSFGGALADIADVKSAGIGLPVLRKDFMVDPIQVIEARAADADAILIILAAVSDALASELHAAADEHGLSVLLEVHDEAELERALRLPSPLVGVNNRDLRTFETDLATTERLAMAVPASRLLISESGIRDESDIARLRRCGARGFLIGESLMRAEQSDQMVRQFCAVR
jgi:indole-3-glycerol phosphate synthase